MLYIQKSRVPDTLKTALLQIEKDSEWQSISPDNHRALRDYFDKTPKDAIRQYLVAQQHGLCAYCMKRINADDALHTTIEHFIPLSKDKSKGLKLENMLAVCDGGRQKNKEVDDHNKNIRILCCDAQKEDAQIKIDPYNAKMMEEIEYNRSGIMGTNNEEYRKDINCTLQLNGRLIPEQQNQKFPTPQADTATGIIKGRKDAYRKYEALMRILNSKGKMTAEQIQRKIEQLLSQEIYDEYVGVVVFFLKRKQRYIQAQKR